MMPGLGFAETILLVIVAIVVIGPKDLPLMMRKFGRFTGRMRALAFEFRQGFDELGRQAELDELRREVADLKERSGLSDLERDMVNDAASLQRDVAQPLAPATIGPMASMAAATTVTPPTEAPPAAADEAPLEPLAVAPQSEAAPEASPVFDLPDDGNRIAAPREDVVAR